MSTGDIRYRLCMIQKKTRCSGFYAKFNYCYQNRDGRKEKSSLKRMIRGANNEEVNLSLGMLLAFIINITMYLCVMIVKSTNYRVNKQDLYMLQLYG